MCNLTWKLTSLYRLIRDYNRHLAVCHKFVAFVFPSLYLFVKITKMVWLDNQNYTVILNVQFVLPGESVWNWFRFQPTSWQPWCKHVAWYQWIAKPLQLLGFCCCWCHHSENILLVSGMEKLHERTRVFCNHNTTKNSAIYSSMLFPTHILVLFSRWRHHSIIIGGDGGWTNLSLAWVKFSVTSIKDLPLRPQS